MNRRIRLTLAAAGLLATQLVTQAQGSATSAALPLSTRPLQFTGVGGTNADAEALMSLRTGELRFTGIAGR
jgi:hypothetical protein